MIPKIQATSFGSITIAGHKYTRDVWIGLDGKVRKRKKKLSKAVYGTSHRISLAEAEYIYDPGVERVLIGGGMINRVSLSSEAAAFFDERGVAVEIVATPKAIQRWNDAEGEVIGLFHITC